MGCANARRTRTYAGGAGGKTALTDDLRPAPSGPRSIHGETPGRKGIRDCSEWPARLSNASNAALFKPQRVGHLGHALRRSIRRQKSLIGSGNGIQRGRTGVRDVGLRGGMFGRLNFQPGKFIGLLKLDGRYFCGDSMICFRDAEKIYHCLELTGGPAYVTTQVICVELHRETYKTKDYKRDAYWIWGPRSDVPLLRMRIDARAGSRILSSSVVYQGVRPGI